MEQKIHRVIKLYPLYSALTVELLFYIAIDTLFLTIVKGFSPAQIVSINSFSQLACIGLQFPILYVIKQIGNTKAVRIGSLCLVVSSIFITFGKTYFPVLLGRLFHDIAVCFRPASVVALENNLEKIGRRHEFVRIRTNSNTMYSLITMLISFVASLMFTFNNYLPMIGCITTCTIGCILSFYIKDYSDFNTISPKHAKGTNTSVHYSRFMILAIAVYAVFYSIMGKGLSQGKLFIQQNILLSFDIDTTSLILGGIISISRIIRVLSNIIFARLYEKSQNITGVILSVSLCCSIGCMLFGSFIPLVFVKIVIMSLGYAIILFVRDPFNLYMQDTVFKYTPKEQHQTLLTIFSMGEKIISVGMGLSFSAILINYPMVIIITILFILALLEIYLSIWLYKIIGKSNTSVKEIELC